VGQAAPVQAAAGAVKDFVHADGAAAQLDGDDRDGIRRPLQAGVEQGGFAAAALAVKEQDGLAAVGG